MKAWFVWVGTPYYDWGDYVHGETASKAKSMFWKEWSYEADEWTRLRPIRCPEFDDKPITGKAIYEFTDDDSVWYPICKCGICKGEK